MLLTSSFSECPIFCNVQSPMGKHKTCSQPQSPENSIPILHHKVLKPFCRSQEYENSNRIETQPVVEMICGTKMLITAAFVNFVSGIWGLFINFYSRPPRF
uniref:AlNc14C191G8445 protein n=1 Tax=Albugo laibachii Nc14 TaxID=890382 RepID=F0WPV4_9STRA|nr:AlNc14C191G8445 [Albugo laibachii Nc14]|eukprot:CCA23355.1 AlNc14C191G8445 [Albugo laibachii Nc14]